MRSPLSLPFSRLNRASSSLSWRSGLTLRSNLAGGMSWQRLPGIKQTHTQKSALRREIPWNFTGWGFKDSVAVLWQEMLEEQQANDEWAAQPYSDRGWLCTGNIKKNVTVDWMKWLFPSVCLQEALYCETGVCPVEAFKGAGEQGTFLWKAEGISSVPPWERKNNRKYCCLQPPKGSLQRWWQQIAIWDAQREDRRLTL